MRRALLRRLPTLIGITLFGLALFSLGHEFRGHDLADVIAAIGATPAYQLVAAAALTAICYVLFTVYDVLSLRLFNHRVRYRRVAYASFVSYAIGNTTGLSAVAAGSMRYRFYRQRGLSAKDVAKVTAACSLTFTLGFLAVAGVSFLIAPLSIPHNLPVPFATTAPAGILLLGLLGIYFVYNRILRRPLYVGTWKVPSLPLGISAAQTIVSSVELLCSCAILWMLLPSGTGVPYLSFLSIYLLAHVTGIASQSPGGAGVFEGVIVGLLSPALPVPAVIGSLLLYRIIYTAIPFVWASFLLFLYEFMTRTAPLPVLTDQLAPAAVTENVQSGSQSR